MHLRKQSKEQIYSLTSLDMSGLVLVMVQTVVWVGSGDYGCTEGVGSDSQFLCVPLILFTK